MTSKNNDSLEVRVTLSIPNSEVEEMLGVDDSDSDEDGLILSASMEKELAEYIFDDVNFNVDYVEFVDRKYKVTRRSKYLVQQVKE